MLDLGGTASRSTARTACMRQRRRASRSSAHRASTWAPFPYRGIPTTWPSRVPTRRRCSSSLAEQCTGSRWSQKGIKVGRNSRDLALPGEDRSARSDHREDTMTFRASIGATALAAAMLTTIAGASAQDATKYPDWSGQWIGKIGGYDPSKPPGRGQEAPLTTEYQAIFEAGLADYAAGGQGNNPTYLCI